MNSEMVRLNITLPVSLSKELNRFSGPRKRSRFIADAIELKIRQLKKKELEKSLEEVFTGLVVFHELL